MLVATLPFHAYAVHEAGSDGRRCAPMRLHRSIALGLMLVDAHELEPEALLVLEDVQHHLSSACGSTCEHLFGHVVRHGLWHVLWHVFRHFRQEKAGISTCIFTCVSTCVQTGEDRCFDTCFDYYFRLNLRSDRRSDMLQIGVLTFDRRSDRCTITPANLCFDMCVDLCFLDSCLDMYSSTFVSVAGSSSLVKNTMGLCVRSCVQTQIGLRIRSSVQKNDPLAYA